MRPHRSSASVATLAALFTGACAPPDLGGGGAISVGECRTPDNPARDQRLADRRDQYSIRLPGMDAAPPHPIPGAQAGTIVDVVRILEHGQELTDLADEDVAWLDDELPCGLRDAELAVFCPPDAADLAAGPHQVIWYRLAAPFPLDTTQHYQYGLSMDRDGVRTNNYRPGDTATFLGSRDFFYDTDLWITLDHVPGTGWAARVRDARGGTIRDRASDLRVIVDGDRVILLIPDHELDGGPGGAPGYRISIHCHTGDYGVSSPWSGITIPGTQALLPIATTACADELDIFADDTDLSAGESTTLAAQARCSGNGAAFDGTDQVMWESTVDDLSFGPYGRLSVSPDAMRGTTVTIAGRHPIVSYDEIQVRLNQASLIGNPTVTVGSGVLAVGVPIDARAHAMFDDGSTADVTTTVTWTTSDPLLATVGDVRPAFTITPRRAGTVVIGAALGQAAGAATVAISEAPPTMMSIEPQTVTVPLGVRPPVSLVMTLDDGATADVTDSPSLATRLYWLTVHGSGPACVDTVLSPPDREPIPYKDDIDVVVDRMPAVTIRPSPIVTIEEGQCLQLGLDAETGGRRFDVTRHATWSAATTPYVSVGTSGAAKGRVCGEQATAQPVPIAATYGAEMRMFAVNVVPVP